MRLRLCVWRSSAAVVCALMVATAAGAATLALVPYADPDKLFTISYPSGWKVKRIPSSHVTTFYLDDADEGTAFSILSGSVTIKGEMSATQVFETVLYGPSKKRYPDFKIMGHQERPMGDLPNGTILEVIAAWTNSRHVSMHGYAKVFAIKNTGRGSTTISLLSYQAPAKDYDRLEPTFNEMIRTTRYAGAQSK